MNNFLQIELRIERIVRQHSCIEGKGLLGVWFQSPHRGHSKTSSVLIYCHIFCPIEDGRGSKRLFVQEVIQLFIVRKGSMTRFISLKQESNRKLE